MSSSALLMDDNFTNDNFCVENNFDFLNSWVVPNSTGNSQSNLAIQGPTTVMSLCGPITDPISSSLANSFCSVDAIEYLQQPAGSIHQGVVSRFYSPLQYECNGLRNMSSLSYTSPSQSECEIGVISEYGLGFNQSFFLTEVLSHTGCDKTAYLEPTYDLLSFSSALQTWSVHQN